MCMGKRARRGAAKNRRSEAGETLVESLAAILMIGLSSLLFLTMFMASSKIFRQAEARYETVYEDIAAADVKTNPLADGDSIGKITVTGKGTAGASDETVGVDVDWYGNKDYVLSYKVK